MRFNGHPPLGVNATGGFVGLIQTYTGIPFQWAPTLGGECYEEIPPGAPIVDTNRSFNGHPPLGVNATGYSPQSHVGEATSVSMGTHPWG